MFGFLKDKLKKAVDSFSKKAGEELEEEKPADKKETKETKSKSEEKKESKKEKKTEKKEKKREEKKETKKKEKKAEEKIEYEAEEKSQDECEEKSEGKKSGFFGRLFGKKEKEETPEEEKEKKKQQKEERQETGKEKKKKQTQEEKEAETLDKEAEAIGLEAEEEEKQVEAEEESEGKKSRFFGKIGDAFTKKTLSEEKFEELFWDLEISLLESNVALEVIEKIKKDLKESMVNSKVSRSSIEETVARSLKKSIDEILTFETLDITKKIKGKSEKPYVIVFVGVNGSGKTTTLAKIANYLKTRGFSVVMAAGDTFRAAAIHQLEIHAEKIGVKIIKQDYGSDAAAVAFDAIAHAKANKKDVVLIDTAGRSHANVNLMDELKKVIRVAKPDLTLFVGDSITGNDMVEQAREFNAAVNVDGLVLSKADVDEKGGATISATFITKKPIAFIGTGQEYKDIEEFDKDKIMKNLEI